MFLSIEGFRMIGVFWFYKNLHNHGENSWPRWLNMTFIVADTE